MTACFEYDPGFVLAIPEAYRMVTGKPLVVVGSVNRGLGRITQFRTMPGGSTMLCGGVSFLPCKANTCSQ